MRRGRGLERVRILDAKQRGGARALLNNLEVGDWQRWSVVGRHLGDEGGSKEARKQGSQEARNLGKLEAPNLYMYEVLYVPTRKHLIARDHLPKT